MNRLLWIKSELLGLAFCKEHSREALERTIWRWDGLLGTENVLRQERASICQFSVEMGVFSLASLRPSFMALSLSLEEVS